MMELAIRLKNSGWLDVKSVPPVSREKWEELGGRWLGTNGWTTERIHPRHTFEAARIVAVLPVDRFFQYQPHWRLLCGLEDLAWESRPQGDQEPIEIGVGESEQGYIGMIDLRFGGEILQSFYSDPLDTVGEARLAALELWRAYAMADLPI